MGTAGATGLAGCLGSDDDGTADDSDTGNGGDTDDNGETDDTGDDASDDGTTGDDSTSGDSNGDDSTDSGTDGSSDDGSDDDGSDDDSSDNGSDDGGTVTATIHTNFGDIEVELYGERAPRTVDNFVGLATGEKTWTDPETGEEIDGEPLYEDIIFHRVIEGFVIQGGDPTGTGTGGPGYEFDDEFHPELSHDEAGILSMANSGPDTNGSQFFITLAPQPHLDGMHSVFGRVIDGMGVVEEIGSVETDANDRPVETVVLESVTVHDG
jgi:peptidyl-prolyl cis-trans isomerase A (cyclophilin A)